MLRTNDPLMSLQFRRTPSMLRQSSSNDSCRAIACTLSWPAVHLVGLDFAPSLRPLSFECSPSVHPALACYIQAPAYHTTTCPFHFRFYQSTISLKIVMLITSFGLFIESFHLSLTARTSVSTELPYGNLLTLFMRRTHGQDSARGHTLNLPGIRSPQSLLVWPSLADGCILLGSPSRCSLFGSWGTGDL
jgi:hypothetical protein